MGVVSLIVLLLRSGVGSVSLVSGVSVIVAVVLFSGSFVATEVFTGGGSVAWGMAPGVCGVVGGEILSSSGLSVKVLSSGKLAVCSGTIFVKQGSEVNVD